MELPRRERPKPEELKREAEEKEKIIKEIKKARSGLIILLKNAIESLDKGGSFSLGENRLPLFKYIFERIKDRFDSDDPQIKNRFDEIDILLLGKFFSGELSEIVNNEEVLQKLDIERNDEFRGELIKICLAEALRKLQILLIKNPDLILSASS